MLSGARSVNSLAGGELVCAIDLGNGMYGLETGLNYELMSRFAQDNHCSVRIVAAGKKDNYIDSLRQGSVDIVITHDIDSLSDGEIDILRQVTDCSVWALNSPEDNDAMLLNRWISYIKTTEDYSSMSRKYSASGFFTTTSIDNIGMCIPINVAKPLIEQVLRDYDGSMVTEDNTEEPQDTTAATADSPLLGLDNMIFTPHIAWACYETRQRLMDVAVNNVRQFLAGTPVNNVAV